MGLHARLIIFRISRGKLVVLGCRLGNVIIYVRLPSICGISDCVNYVAVAYLLHIYSDYELMLLKKKKTNVFIHGTRICPVC